MIIIKNQYQQNNRINYQNIKQSNAVISYHIEFRIELCEFTTLFGFFFIEVYQPRSLVNDFGFFFSIKKKNASKQCCDTTEPDSKHCCDAKQCFDITNDPENISLITLFKK